MTDVNLSWQRFVLIFQSGPWSAANVAKNHVSITWKNRGHSLCLRHGCLFCFQNVMCTCPVYITYRLFLLLCMTSAFANTNQMQNMILMMTESHASLTRLDVCQIYLHLALFHTFSPFSRCLRCYRQAREMRWCS